MTAEPPVMTAPDLFSWKRAFFTAWPSDPIHGVDRTCRLELSKAPNIYELEKRVYMDIELPHHPEFPIDVFLHPAPYWLLAVLLSVVNVFISVLARGDVSLAGLVFGALVQFTLILLFLLPTLRAIRRYRERRSAGLV